MHYQLPNIPGHVAGKEAVLSINGEETLVKGRIAQITTTMTPQGSSAVIEFDGRCVKAVINEGVPHVLEVKD